MTQTQIQHGKRPFIWKLLYWHISVKNYPILMKFDSLHWIRLSSQPLLFAKSQIHNSRCRTDVILRSLNRRDSLKKHVIAMTSMCLLWYYYEITRSKTAHITGKINRLNWCIRTTVNNSRNYNGECKMCMTFFRSTLTTVLDELQKLYALYAFTGLFIVSPYRHDAMLVRVIAIVTCLSVCLSVRLSVCHEPVLCQNEEN